MKNLILLILLSILFSAEAISQRRPAPGPPPMALFSEPKATELKEFVPKNGDFRATFPGVAQSKFTETVAADITTYRVLRSGHLAEIIVADFENEMENNESIFEFYKPSGSSSSVNTIDVSLGTRKGREIVADIGLRFERVRVFPIGNRIYELRCGAMNWSEIVKNHPARAKAFNSECDRFFKSFEVLKFPPSSVPGSPDEFLGVTTETSFDNTFFGFRMERTPGWDLLDESETRKAMREGQELFESDREAFRKQLAASLEKELILLGMKRSDPTSGASVLISVQKLPSVILTSAALLEATAKLFSQSENLTVGERKVKRVNGVRVAFADATNTAIGVPLKQRIFVVIRRGYSLSIVFTWFKDRDGLAIDKMISSFEFK